MKGLPANSLINIMEMISKGEHPPQDTLEAAVFCLFHLLHGAVQETDPEHMAEFKEAFIGLLAADVVDNYTCSATRDAVERLKIDTLERGKQVELIEEVNQIVPWRADETGREATS